MKKTTLFMSLITTLVLVLALTGCQNNTTAEVVDPIEPAPADASLIATPDIEFPDLGVLPTDWAVGYFVATEDDAHAKAQELMSDDTMMQYLWFITPTDGFDFHDTRDETSDESVLDYVPDANYFVFSAFINQQDYDDFLASHDVEFAGSVIVAP